MANTNIVVTNNLKTSFAEDFINSFSANVSSYYLYIGKCLPWANEPTLNTGDLEVANTTYDYQKDVWFDMIAARKIGGDSVRFVIPKRSFVANTVYTAWDDKSNTLYSSANGMYVITTNNNVFKCISNGNTSLAVTNPESLGNFTDNNGFLKSPADGYVWKYMYNINTSDNLYVTNDYVLVPKSNSTGAIVVGGTVDRVVVENGGSAYNTFGGITTSGNGLSIVTITGDGIGAVATANCNANGTITAISVVSIGSGYTYANIAVGGTADTGGGTGCIARVVLSPKEGHAAFPAKELGANSVIVAVRVGRPDSTEGNTFPTTANNSFRQFGILKSPYKYGTSTISTANSVSQSTNITVVPDATGNYLLGQSVYQVDSSGNTVFSGIVADVVSNTVKCVRTRGAIVVGSILYTPASAAAKKVSSYTYPAFEPYSGSLMYIENIEKVTRNTNQAETFRVIFGF